MKERRYISLSIPPEHGASALEELMRIGCAQWWEPPYREGGPYLFNNTFDSTDPRLWALKELIEDGALKVLKDEQSAFGFFERVDRVYTPKELRSAPLLVLTVDRRPLEFTAPEYGTEYDLSTGCPECGTGVVQVSPLKMRRSDVPQTGLICQTVEFAYLVASSLGEALREAEVNGLELREAVSHHDGKPLGWFQMIAHHTMPRMSSKTRGFVRGEGREAPCKRCDRDAYYHTLKEPGQIVYERPRGFPEDLPDVVQSWEHFGKTLRDDDGRLCVLSQPLFFLKPKVFDLFRKLKVRHVKFEPVEFVD